MKILPASKAPCRVIYSLDFLFKRKVDHAKMPRTYKSLIATAEERSQQVKYLLNFRNHLGM